MGQTMPKAVESIVVKRRGSALFRVGFAEMNGWRNSMEDAHVIFMQESWGFFGVFDGHGGSQCSEFIAARMEEELKKSGPPEDESCMKELALRLDREFLELKQPSGSTGTFACVQPSQLDPGRRYHLRVGNIGDSRVLLSRADGTLVEGSGTDGGLTTDHKPDHPSETQRIERTGGRVEMVMGVARVNGDLAVSRSFGDAPYKETGGPSQEDHPVSAAPEVCELTCDASDFLVLVCDGISEGEFPNREVVKLAAEELKRSAAAGEADPGAAAAAVCRKALETGSKDNLSCLVVLLGGGACPGPERELLPGPFDAPLNGAWRKAYQAMAEHAGLTLEEAVEMRYDAARRECAEAASSDAGASGDAAASRLQSLQGEIDAFGAGPPKKLESKSEERVAWFREWLDKNEPEESPDTAIPHDQLMRLMDQPPRIVRVVSASQLRPLVEATTSIKWSEELGQICGGARGLVMQDDPLDSTSEVRVDRFNVWLPTQALTTIEEEEGSADEDDEDGEDDDEASASRADPGCAPEPPLKRQRCA